MRVDGSTVTLAGQIQCRDSARWGVQREFNRRILDKFTERGIEIANPQRNFVILGGDASRALDHEEASADQRGERGVTQPSAPARADKPAAS